MGLDFGHGQPLIQPLPAVLYLLTIEAFCATACLKHFVSGKITGLVLITMRIGLRLPSKLDSTGKLVASTSETP